MSERVRKCGNCVSVRFDSFHPPSALCTLIYSFCALCTLILASLHCSLSVLYLPHILHKIMAHCKVQNTHSTVDNTPHTSENTFNLHTSPECSIKKTAAGQYVPQRYISERATTKTLVAVSLSSSLHCVQHAQSSVSYTHTVWHTEKHIDNNAVLDGCRTVSYKCIGWDGWDGMVSGWGDV